MAAVLRLLLRRRAEAPSAPSLALLQPLFPRPYSKLSGPPVPSLLCRTLGKGCSALLPRKPTNCGCEATTQRTIQGCAPPLPQQPIDPQTFQSLTLEQVESLTGTVNELIEQPALVLKGIKTCEKATDLLAAGVHGDKVFAMFEKGVDDALNAIAVYEKDLDVLAKAFGSIKGMPLDIDLEPKQRWCKETKNWLESMRQKMKELQRCIEESQRSRETHRTLKKIYKWLEVANVILQALILLLTLLINMRIYLS